MSLSPVERAILTDLSENGDNVPTNIADSTGHHSKSVSRSLSNLEDREIVRNKGRGVWTLTADGKELAARLLEWQQKIGAAND